MEEQILLRVPPEIAQRLNRLIDEGKSTSTPATNTTTSSSINQSPISLTFISNTTVTLQCDKQSLEGTVVELPCVIETLKTFDNIAYYKTADIAQMIILHAAQQPATTNPPATNTSLPPASASSSSANQPAATDKAKEAIPPPPIKYPSGLLPPTRDIRPKRFERDTLIQPRIVSDVETMLQYIRDETHVHTFRLIEEEVEIEVDEDDEWEDEADGSTTAAALAAANTPNSANRPASSFTQPHRPSPLPTIRIDSDTAGGSSSKGLSPSASALRPPTSSRMSPSFSPAFLGGGAGSGTPSFTPSLGATDEDDERMREVLTDSGVSPLSTPKGTAGGVVEDEKVAVVQTGPEGQEEKSEERMRVDEEAKMAEAGPSQESIEAAGRDSRKNALLGELSELERRIEQVNVAINKEQNQLLKRRMRNERLQPLEEERNAKKTELDAL